MSLFPELDQTPGADDKGGEPAKPEGDPRPGRRSARPARGEKAARKGKAAPPAGYVALARKYRPSQFDEVIGQKAVSETLRNAITTGRLHHAYLFSGIRGVGKTTAARLFARALNCVKGPTPDPCGECDPCREIASGLSMDVIELDAASNRGVDDVEPLREAARYAPSRDRYKVFILDEVHMLSNAAFNSLLKILEEPPPRIVWIMATTEYRKVPPTVVSRCQHFEFRRVPGPEVTGYLARIAGAEGATIEGRGLEIIAGAAGGSVRDAVSLLDQVLAYAGERASEEDVRRAIGVIDRRHLLEYLGLVASRDAAGLLDLVARLADGGTDFSQFASGLVTTVRDATLARYSADGRALALTDEEVGELRELAGSFSEDGLLRVFHALLEVPAFLRGSPNPRFALEAATLRLARMADLQPIEEVIAGLRDAAQAPRAGGSQPPAARGGGILPAAGGGGTEIRAAALPAAESEEAVPPAGGPLQASGNGDPSWRDRFLRALQARRLSLRTFVEGARHVIASDDTICIRIDESQTFFRQGLESDESRALLEEAAAEISGRPMSVRVEVVGGAASGEGGAPPPPQGAGRRDRLIQQAMSRPGVRMVMDAFSGRIVDIRETN